MRTLSFVIACGLMWGGLARAADDGFGSISGTVRLTGPVPTIPMIYTKQDVDVCGSRARPAQSLVLGTNQAVRDAVVYLGPIASAGRRLIGDASAILDQRGCEFVPRVQTAESGAMLVLRNSDPTLHVVRIDSLNGTNGPTTLLHVATPYAGYEKKFQLPNFKEPTLLKATDSNGHGWMTAYLAIMPGWPAMLTDVNGRFTLAGIPSGAYKLYAWHEVLGTLARDVKVSGGRVTSVDLEFGSNRNATAASTAPKSSYGPAADW